MEYVYTLWSGFTAEVYEHFPYKEHTVLNTFICNDSAHSSSSEAMFLIIMIRYMNVLSGCKIP